MVSVDNSSIWLILLIIGRALAVSYNQPTFCPTATWNPNAKTFANVSTVSTSPHDIFVDTNNTIYVSASDNSQVVVWQHGSINPTKIISKNLAWPKGIFITNNGDIFVDNGGSNQRVDKFPFNRTSSIPVMTVSEACWGLFVDINNTLYCSIGNNNKVVKRWLTNNASTTKTAAGTGTAGSASNMLNYNQGIFVDINFDLYVADRDNDRIQLFRSGQVNGITVAGSSTINITISLAGPTSVVLDGNKYLFIVDQDYARIIGSGANGFRCLVACSGSSGSASNQLDTPFGLSFDSYGNMFVTDQVNNRLQKFFLATNSCGLTTMATAITTSKASTSLLRTSSNVKSLTTMATATTTSGTSTSLLLTSSNVKDLTTMTTAIATSGTSTSLLLTTTVVTSSIVRTTTITSMTTTAALIATSSLVPSSSTAQTTMISMSIIQTDTAFPTSTFISTKMLTSMLTTTTVHPSSTFQSTIMSMITSQMTSTYLASTTSLRINDCSGPIISLSPSNPLFNEPLLIQRSQAFSIGSSLQFDCSISLATFRQWTIHECVPRCTVDAQLEQSLTTMTYSELYIPARTLKYGIYRITLTVTMSASLQLISSATTYIEIVPSPITVNLVQFGVLIIMQKQQENLTLDPGTFSVDPDTSYFNFTNWNYTYSCQIYGINDSTSDLLNSPCFSRGLGNKTQWQYGSTRSQSSLIIFGGSLRSNESYEFKVDLIDLHNSTKVFTGHLLVQIEDNLSMVIIIECVFPKMCPSNGQFQMINPTSQIALTSFCISNSTILFSNIFIEWNIYYGSINSSSNIVQWTLLDNITNYKNIYFFGLNLRNFTAITNLFMMHSNVEYWRFESVYSVGSIRSMGYINFIVNFPPKNGSCLINPLNGSTTTIFTITCFDWFDSNGIKDYSFYIWTTDRLNRMLLGFTTSNTFQVRMPTSDLNSTQLHLIVRIRDTFDSVTEMNMSDISILPDTINITTFLTAVQLTLNNTINISEITSNPFIHILYGTGYNNDLCQWLISISQVLNNKAKQNLLLAIENNIPAVSISVSSLNEIYEIFNNNLSDSFYIEFREELNLLSNSRDYLMMFINNLTITTIDSIILQSTTIVQLTESTNQLTRFTLSVASTKCYQLSVVLFNVANMTTYDDVKTAANQLFQCLSNVLTAVNIPLQQRGIILDLDNSRRNNSVLDYDAEGRFVEEISLEFIQKCVNCDYQEELSKMITIQYKQTKAMITNALKMHMNVEQSWIINTSSVLMFLKRFLIDELPNQIIQLNDNTRIKLPSTINFNLTNMSSVILQCVLTSLPMFGNRIVPITNLSRLLSIDFVDENGNEMSINTSIDHPFEIMIPSDINWIVPPWIVQNVLSLVKNSTITDGPFNLYFIDMIELNVNISKSIQFEMRPLNQTLGYMLIYKFDSIPQLNSSRNEIDGWSLFCLSNLTNDNLFTYFIDNQRTSKHQSITFGIRELNAIEMSIYCSKMPSNPPITDDSFHFTANYELRIFRSACYYLDSNLTWQSDGLTVGPLTNHIRAQCFSTHLSTFAAGFLILPSPINWKYVFANSDFNKNRTVYLTVIVILLIYIIFLIWSRYHDKKDANKFDVTVLLNNGLNNTYLYQIVIFTGLRKNSERNKTVEIILSGVDDQTDVRTLFDSNRKVFSRGSIDSFLIGVPKSLGRLTTLHVWLNNSSDNRKVSWFFKYALVRDLQTMETFHFICQEWLNAEQMNRSTEHIFSVANNSQKQKFHLNLVYKIYHNIFDEHLWFSIFNQSPSSQFTRVQRCTCCFVLFYLGMCLNIIYYDQIQTAKTGPIVNGLSIGPFHFSREEIMIGIITDLLLFIPSIFLVLFFRQIRRRRSLFEISPIFQIVSQLRSLDVLINNYEKQRKKKHRKLFPWWCLFIAYGLSFIMIIISILLIIARGIEFGEVKVEKWLGSLIITFFSSVLLSQPLKVIGGTIFFVLLKRKTKFDKKSNDYIDENEDFYLNGDEERIEPIQNNTFLDGQCKTQSIELRNFQSIGNIPVKNLDQFPFFINMFYQKSSLTEGSEQTSSPQSMLTTDCFVEDL